MLCVVAAVTDLPAWPFGGREPTSPPDWQQVGFGGVSTEGPPFSARSNCAFWVHVMESAP